METTKYCDYFDVNEKYFPCIDESAINNGAAWDTTYPHETFIELLNTAEKMLAGSTGRSLWIHGAYGTGKSQCAFALKKILEAPEEEVRQYWNKFEPLKKSSNLLEKIMGHRERGIVVAYRYASGSIVSPQQLFFAIQESVIHALEVHDINYKGENSLKETAIAWLQEPSHSRFIDDLLKKSQWMSVFTQSTAEEIINALKKGRDVSELMENLFSLASAEGIRVLDFTADSLRNWIIDIVSKNNIKICFIWDEFSDYFRNNSTSLSEFQKICSICQETPFYFIIVTHPLSSLAKGYDAGDKSNPWSVVQQRFDKVEISLPNNIAFELIGHAFSIKDASKDAWKQMTNELTARVADASSAVAKAVNITNRETLSNILPIHPIAALVLKNIAEAFQSNQRSMFDFVKTSKDMDVKAFQWFIQNTGPYSNRPFLSVDMLWDFFYVKGKDYLSYDIKLILDTFPQQTHLMEKEKAVLKTVLIMQAIDLRLGSSLPILKPTDQNISYAFMGDDELESSCRGLAKALVKKGVLVEAPVAEGKIAYNAAILAGDGAKIDSYKKKIREEATTAKLVAEGQGVAAALNLSPALKLRYAVVNSERGDLPCVTKTNFKQIMDMLKSKDAGWRFYAVLALAVTEEEAQSFRTLIKETIANPEYKNITVIDALSTPLGLERFEQYVDFSSMSMYYNGQNNSQARQNAQKAKDVLERDWKDNINNGRFIVFTYDNQEGEKAVGASSVQTILKTIVLRRFKHIQDFTKNLTETQLKATTQVKQVAKYGMGATEIKGPISGCQNTVLGKVWSKEKYWLDESLSQDHIVIIKKAVNKTIADAFNESGKISIRDIYDYLQGDFGFSCCNLSAFITGFLLKEYSSEPYRFMDEEGHRDAMNPDKLAEMIGNCYWGDVNGKAPKSAYIVSLTDEEKAFYDFTESVWGISANSCSSPVHAAYLISQKMRNFQYPVWCLEEVDSQGAFDMVNLYIKLVQSKGDEAHNVANDIGKIVLQQNIQADNIQKLLTKENCMKGMQIFLESFEGGIINDLAQEIGAENNILTDIKNLFTRVENSFLWIRETGENEIKKLITEYEMVKVSNGLLNSHARSKEEAFKAWRDYLKFAAFSCESIQSLKPSLDTFFTEALRIAKGEDMLPDRIKTFLDEMIKHSDEIKEILSNNLAIFKEIYELYLEGFSDAECEEIKNSLPAGIFSMSSIKSNALVKNSADEFKRKQAKSQLYNLWKEKTYGTKNPHDWSEKHRTPILCCISPSVYADAKRAFTILNSREQSESDIHFCLDFIDKADFFEDIAKQQFRDKCFANCIIGDYQSIGMDIEKVRNALERTGICAYDWNDDPRVKSKVANMAAADYNAGGVNKAIDVIDAMSGEELKKWLNSVVKKDMELGMKIIINKEG